MKLIAAYTSNSGDSGLKCLVWPDSAIIRSGKPVFLPEDTSVHIHLGIGALIKSVGKSIEPKFALRYYDNVAPMAFLLPEGVSDKLAQCSDPLASDIVADYSIVEGNSFETIDLAQDIMIKATVKSLRNPEEPEHEKYFVQKDWKTRLGEAISAASRRNTLKTGDIVAILGRDRIDAEFDTLIRVAPTSGSILIETKIK